MKKEDFLRYYAGLTNIELLKIVEEKEKYQPVAIEVAQQILSERNYSNDELNAAQTEINLIVNKKTERGEKIKTNLKRINGFIDEHFGIGERSPEKTLNLFCVALFLFNAITGFSSIRNFSYFFTYKISGYMVGVLVYLLPLIIIYLLYKRSTWGWILFVGFYTVSAILNIQTFVDSFRLRAGPPAFLYPRLEPYSVAFALFINTCIVLFLNRKNIFRQYTIPKDGRILTFISSTMIAILIIYIFS